MSQATPATTERPVSPCMCCESTRTTAEAGQVNEGLVAPTEEDVEDNQEIRIEEENGDDVEIPKMAKDPGQPTARQVGEHKIVHVPYRSWCKWCVLGRGRGIQHRGTAQSLISLVGLDYFYITKGGLKRREELDYGIDEEGDRAMDEARSKGDIVKCLLVRCLLTKAVF